MTGPSNLLTTIIIGVVLVITGLYIKTEILDYKLPISKQEEVMVPSSVPSPSTSPSPIEPPYFKFIPSPVAPTPPPVPSERAIKAVTKLELYSKDRITDAEQLKNMELALDAHPDLLVQLETTIEVYEAALKNASKENNNKPQFIFMPSLPQYNFPIQPQPPAKLNLPIETRCTSLVPESVNCTTY